ncbi:class II aaRS and biotin synthetase [Xylaria sp. CBS 124048]|nr:class II aaRS and biotin synthetase [Xylaria sp. CBS 124048]
MSSSQRCLSRQQRITFSRPRYPRDTSSRRTISHESQTSNRYTHLSKFWLPAGGITVLQNEGGHDKLIRAGYLRQSHAGIFHMLPFGERVQAKLEKLIDKHMAQLGATKVSLSSISSQALWQQTNRLEGYGPELFRFSDRKNAPYILAPTHEEEITTLVAKTVNSYKSLPLRLYQIGRKYRDEIRPRHGLLRSREFVMKDLYTFDRSLKTALETYEEARAAYSRLFDELKVPYLVAEASSGDIGGDLSHEYHLPSSAGEDNVISCQCCKYIANEEVATARPGPVDDDSHESLGPVHVWRGISKDRQTLVNVWYPAPFADTDINAHVLKSILPTLDSSLEHAVPLWETALSQSDSSTTGRRLQLLNLVDYRLGRHFVDKLKNEPGRLPLLPHVSPVEAFQLDQKYITSSANGEPLNAIRIQDGDLCPRCTSGRLKVQKVIELGHTFHLGTKYSDALDARVQVPPDEMDEGDAPRTNAGTPMQMGCHGIGISRIIGALADHLADESGLNWPRAIAPFEVVVVSNKDVLDDAASVARAITESSDTSSRSIDLALDDRLLRTMPWKMKDADLIGYPVIVLLGRKWASDRMCEVQCRQLRSVTLVPFNELRQHVSELLDRL